MGQQINLANQLLALPSGISVSYKWTIPGSSNGTAFKDYEPTVNNCNYTKLSTADLAQPYCNFYWSDSATNRLVTCTTVIPGQTNVVTAYFNVVRPSARVFETNGSIAADTNYAKAQVRYNPTTDGLPWLHFGTAIESGGANFTNSISEPSNFMGGSNEWVQVLNADTNIVMTTNSVTRIQSSGLDSTLPYNDTPGISQVTDSPASPLATNSVSVYRNFNATMFLLWRPSPNSVQGDNTVWVPLRGFQWSWSAIATNSAPTNNGSGWTRQNPMLPTTTIDADVTNEVIWTNLSTWQPY